MTTHVSMQKLQVLFPEPQLRRLRDLARREDRPVSEVIRIAVDAWLAKVDPDHREEGSPKIPVFRGGEITMAPHLLRDAAHSERTGVDE